MIRSIFWQLDYWFYKFMRYAACVDLYFAERSGKLADAAQLKKEIQVIDNRIDDLILNME